MPKQRLDSWKAIAGYLERSLRTVQRWNAYHGLPVHRFGGVKGGVFAYPEEIDRWLVTLAQETHGAETSEEEFLEAGRVSSRNLLQTAQQMWEARSERNLQTVASLYRKAVDHDPSNGEALAGLANTLIFGALHGILDGAVAYPGAQDALQRIGASANWMASAQCAMAWLNLLYKRERRQARQGFDAALTSRPECTFSLCGRAMLHLAEGEFELAREIAWEAWRMQPSSVPLATQLCFMHALSGEGARTLELVEQLKLGGGYYGTVISAEAYALVCDADPEFHLEELERLAAENRANLSVQGMLGYLYGKVGRTTSALEILFQLDRIGVRKKRSNGYALALVFLGLGNRKSALEWLKTACEEGSPWSLTYRFDPLLKELQGDEALEQVISLSRPMEAGWIATAE